MTVLTNFFLSAEMPANGDTAFIIGVGGSILVIIMMAIIAGIFILLGKYMSNSLKMKKTVKDADECAVPLTGKLPANTVAAISAAIFQYMEESMQEDNTIITIDRAAKTYSPWSSKIYATHSHIFNSRR